MKSKPVKIGEKLFRYDFDHSLVEYIVKASKHEIRVEEEWKEKHNGRGLYGIGEDGYIVLDAVGLHQAHWKSKAARQEYLFGWAEELDAEFQALEDDFVKNELPYIREVYQK